MAVGSEVLVTEWQPSCGWGTETTYVPDFRVFRVYMLYDVLF
jgi:hypothetical protein